MLKEITKEELDAISPNTNKKNDAMHEFAETAVVKFANSQMSIAEVTGWPDGVAESVRAARKRVYFLRRYSYRNGVDVMQRKSRVFLLKKGQRDA